MGLWIRRALTQAEGIQHQKYHCLWVLLGAFKWREQEHARPMPWLGRVWGRGRCVCQGEWSVELLPTCPASRGDLVGPWAGWSKWLWRCWAVHTIVYKCGTEATVWQWGLKTYVAQRLLEFGTGTCGPVLVEKVPGARWAHTEGVQWAGRLALPRELWLEDLSWWSA